MTILIQNDHPDPDMAVYAHTDTCPVVADGFNGWTYNDTGVGVERAIQNFLGDHPEMCAEATDVVVHNCPPPPPREEFIVEADVARAVMAAMDLVEIVSGDNGEEFIASIFPASRPDELLLSFGNGQIFRIAVTEVESS